MDDDIFDFSRPFAFHSLDISAPVKGKGGGYVIHFSKNDSPVYLQPPKCHLKSGFIKSGKNHYCDLLFGMENEKFLQWIEQLEKHVATHIYNNRDDWFDTETMPDLPDIQNYVQPIGKPYKSGRMLIVRTTLPAQGIKIYDDKEKEVDPDTLVENMRVITIVELKNLNCTAHSFQFVLELKQMLISPEKTFDRCLIRGGATPLATTVATSSQPSSAPALTLKQPIGPREPVAVAETIDSPPDSPVSPKKQEPPKVEKREQKKAPPPNPPNPKKPEISSVEFDLAEIENAETMHLTDPKDVYFKMYKEAKQKVKEAKIIALSNYLEAKRIKTTYLSDIMDISDDSDDDEFTIPAIKIK